MVNVNELVSDFALSLARFVETHQNGPGLIEQWNNLAQTLFDLGVTSND